MSKEPRLKISLFGLSQLLKKELEESREENKDRLCQDSKVLDWEAWSEKV